MSSKLFDNLRTGVIGVGSMGQNHARIYREISNLIGVTDIDQKQSHKIAERFGVVSFANYHEMLADVDAVSIAVPTAYHREVAESVAAAGVHLLVEKPLAGNAVDCEAIISSADSGGVILAVGHVERHNPVVTYAKRAIVDQTWGDTIMMSSRRVSSYPDRIRDVGVIFDLAIHDIDVLCHLNGDKVKSVYAIGGCLESLDYEDHVSILLEFTNGKKAHCEVNWLTPMKVRQVNITSTRSYVQLDYISQTVETFSSSFTKLDQKNLFNSEIKVINNKIKITKEEPLKVELIDFLNSVRNSQHPVVSGRDGLNAVLICEAAQESLRSKKKIDLNL